MSKIIAELAAQFRKLDKKDPLCLVRMSRQIHDAQVNLKSNRIIIEAHYDNFVSDLEVILQNIHMALANSHDDYTQILSGDNYKRVSCAELRILKCLVNLYVPIDFCYGKLRGKAHYSHELMTTLCIRGLNFITQWEADIFPYILTNTLNCLSRIDVSFTAELQAQANLLIDACFKISKEQITQGQLWSATSAIHLLWCNASYGLKEDASFKPRIAWAQVHKTLEFIEAEVLAGSFTLDKISARELYQVRGAFVDNQADFPNRLFLEIEKFIPAFVDESHASVVEVEVRELLNKKNGIIDQLAAKHSWIKKENFQLNNPLVPKLGLEADYAYVCPRTGMEIYFQLDGVGYHTFPYYTTPHAQRKTDHRTQFRNWLFERNGKTLHIITPQQNNIGAMTAFIARTVVNPIFYALRDLEAKEAKEKKLIPQMADLSLKDPLVPAFDEWQVVSRKGRPAKPNANNGAPLSYRRT